MDFNKFTIKAQKAVEAAQRIATENENPSIDNVHVLQGIFEVDQSVLPFILRKAGVNPTNFEYELNNAINALPKVHGGTLTLSSSANQMLNKAESLAKSMKDDFVSIEHLILAIMQTSETTARLLRGQGVSEKEVLEAVKELRKGERVTSQSQEDTYDALGKYAKNLN